MKSFKNILFGCLSMTVLFSACLQDKDEFIPDNLPNAGRIVTASIGGTITDEAGNPVQDAKVQIGDLTLSTDENGIFLFQNVRVNNERAFLKANKAGFFTGSRLLFVQENSINYAHIQLLDNAPIGTIAAAAGGSVDLPKGGKLVFPANAIASANGATYSGDVRVAAKWLDPSADNIFVQMPGDLRGITLSDQEMVLATFGMMAVELYSPTGEKLQVANGKEVEMSMPVPANLLGAAPAVIPLWHFDEADGFWKEEGSAQLQSGSYVGKVKHFSFWNCDAPFPLVNLKGAVKTTDGTPLGNIGVYIEFLARGMRGYGSTNQDGIFEGKVPKGEALQISILDPCGVEIYDQAIGPFSQDAVLPDIVLDPALLQNYLKKVTGRLLDCGGAPVDKGYIVFSSDRVRQFVFSEPDGTFETSFVVCQSTNEITVTGFDTENLKQSTPNTFVPTLNQIDLGDLTACDALDEYVIYYLDGTKYTCIFTGFDYARGFTYINGWADSLTQQGNINFQVAGDVVGTFPIQYLSVNNFYVQNTADIHMDATFTTYGATAGEYLEGSFVGDFDASDPGGGGMKKNHTLSGNFRIRRR